MLIEGLKNLAKKSTTDNKVSSKLKKNIAVSLKIKNDLTILLTNSKI